MLKIKDYLIDKDQVLYIAKNQGEDPKIEVVFITGKCISIYFEDEEIRDKEFEKRLKALKDSDINE